MLKIDTQNVNTVISATERPGAIFNKQPNYKVQVFYSNRLTDCHA